VKVRLDFDRGDMAGKTFEFDEPRGFTFGRAPDCTCVVPEEDQRFSRHHFILEIQPPNVVLKDLGSLNGTYVNDVKHGGRSQAVRAEDARTGKPVSLRDGDRIRAGGHEIKVRIDAPILCIDCGRDLPAEEHREAEFVGGTYLCGKCRERERNRKQREIEEREQREREDAERRKQREEANALRLRRLREQRQREFERERRVPAVAAVPRPLRPQPVPVDQIRLNVEQRLRAEHDPGEVIQELLQRFIAERLREKEPQVEVPSIEGYEIQRMVGKGGFGAVFLARRTKDGKRVALKTMLQTRKPPEKQLLAFEREQQIARQLRHPNIVHCEAAGSWNEVHYMEMEFVPGGCVMDLMQKRGGKLPLDLAGPIMLQSLEALAYAHQARLTIELKSGPKKVNGVVHRDLKPPNILLAGTPARPVAKLADFGLAKVFQAAGLTKGDLSVGGGFCGSPPYMAPEHIINYRNLKPVTDVFEVAATFYHMLTGQLVWSPRPGVEIYKIILEQSPTPIQQVDRSIPDTVAEVIDTALNRSPDERYPNARSMLKAMKSAL